MELKELKERDRKITERYSLCKDVRKECDNPNRNNCHLCKDCYCSLDDNLYCIIRKRGE